MITGDLKSKVDRLWTTFWNNGISNPLTVIEQISYLLFIKRLDDEELAKEKRANRLGRKAKSLRFGPKQKAMRWSHFKNTGDADKMLTVVRDKAFPFIKSLGGAGDSSYARHMKDAVFMVGNAALLANVVDQIDQLPMDDRDTKGDLYEYMLSKLTTAGTNGQFRTPRHIIQMMVKMVDPKPSQGESVCDPSCGTAGFLVAASEHVRDAMLKNAKLRGHFNNGMFHGYDFDATMLRIGSMNMMLHGIENPAIEARDSLSEDAAGDDDSYTVVLANPPFKGSVEKSTIAKDLSRVVKTTKTELLFLVQMIRILKRGGRAAVIVPDGVLFGSSKAHKAVRQMLVEDHKLDGVVSMPSGVFKPYAGVSTAILLFTKTGAGGTDHVWFYDMKADGLSLDDKRQPVDDNDIPDILKKWAARNPKKKSNRKARSFFVPKKEIKANSYDLPPCVTAIYPTKMPAGVVTADIIKLSPDRQRVHDRFLAYYLNSPLAKGEIGRFTFGVTRPKVTLSAFKALPVPLPPLPEQRRIAAILDKADAIRRKRREAIALTEELLRSTFLEMFGDPVTNPKGWPVSQLGVLVNVKTGRTPSRKEPTNYGGTVPWVKTTEVRDTTITSTEEYLSERGARNMEVFPPGSLLVAMYGQGATRGRTGLLCVPSTTNQACAVLPPSDKIDTLYLWVLLRLSYERLRDLGRGGNQPNLNLGLIRSFPLLSPPLSQQRIFSKLWRRIAHLCSCGSELQADSDNLFHALVQRAFRGDL